MTLAGSATLVLNASANGLGHFVTTGSPAAIIKGHATNVSGGPHNFHVVSHGLEGEMGCDSRFFTATTSAETTTSLTVTPQYERCYTTPGPWTQERDIPIDMNGCIFTFTVAQGTTDSTEQTGHLLCPAAKKIEATHKQIGCTLAVHPQTFNTDLTYTKKTNPGTGKHEITLDVNVQFSTTRHGGLCIFVPTNGSGTIKGSAAVTAQSGGGVQVHLTAT
jgi:hypothetical protein